MVRRLVVLVVTGPSGHGGPRSRAPTTASPKRHKKGQSAAWEMQTSTHFQPLSKPQRPDFGRLSANRPATGTPPADTADDLERRPCCRSSRRGVLEAWARNLAALFQLVSGFMRPRHSNIPSLYRRGAPDGDAPRLFGTC